MNDILKQVFTYRALVHAISGSVGGISAITVFYPLNKLRLDQQVDKSSKKQANIFFALKQMVEEQGVQALFQGWVSTVVSLGVSNFVYFYTYNAFKVAWQKQLKRSGQDPSIDPLRNLVIASVSGVINVLLTLPLWVVGTRLTTQPKHGKDGKETGETYNGIIDALVKIARKEGVTALWKSLGPSLMLVSNPAIQFVVYEQLKKPLTVRAKARGSPINSVEFFVLGAIAKAVATVLTYPIQIAQSLLRADQGSDKKTRDYTGTVDCLVKLYQVGGFLRWFKGMEAKLWQTVLTAAFQFLTYEQITRVIFWVFLRNQPPKAVAH